MLRPILVFLAIWIALLLLRAAFARRAGRAPVTPARCAHCNMTLAPGTALQHSDGRVYCSPEHARAGP